MQAALSRVRAAGRLRDLSKIYKPLPHHRHHHQKAISFIPGSCIGPSQPWKVNNRSVSICTSYPQPSLKLGSLKTRLPLSHSHDVRARTVMTAASLSDVTLGFYGGGMMAESILKGLLAKNTLPPERIWVCELQPARREALAKLGVSVTAEGPELLSKSDVVVLAIKPNVVPVILRTITNYEKENQDEDLLLISICAGITLDALAEGNPKRNCVRVMPNQPCVVGAGASAFTASTGCADIHKEITMELMGACGLVAELPEKSIDAVTGLSGSGPAYIYMMIEAMSDAGVKEGLPRAVARQLAAQTALGAAKTALELPDVHLGELRNRVESPGGTTIAASATLERNGFRSAVIEAVTEATRKAKEMGNNK